MMLAYMVMFVVLAIQENPQNALQGRLCVEVPVIWFPVCNFYSFRDQMRL